MKLLSTVHCCFLYGVAYSAGKIWHAWQKGSDTPEQVVAVLRNYHCWQAGGKVSKACELFDKKCVRHHRSTVAFHGRPWACHGAVSRGTEGQGGVTIISNQPTATDVDKQHSPTVGYRYEINVLWPSLFPCRAIAEQQEQNNQQRTASKPGHPVSSC